MPAELQLREYEGELTKGQVLFQIGTLLEALLVRGGLNDITARQ